MTMLVCILVSFEYFSSMCSISNEKSAETAFELENTFLHTVLSECLSICVLHLRKCVLVFATEFFALPLRCMCVIVFFPSLHVDVLLFVLS